MKQKKDIFEYKPFSILKDLINNKSLKLVSSSEKKLSELQKFPACFTPSDTELFEDAMKDVKPLNHSDFSWEHKIPSIPASPKIEPEIEIQLALQDLIKGGGDFRVSDTPEYMEGSAPGVNPELVKHLHLGKFSIQASLDLHGLAVKDAEEKIHAFLWDSLNKGLRCVMIIHGRGLSSPDYPKLKEKVRLLLSSGSWSRWIIAFTSARLCDGGAGATYILLRKRPVKKKKKL